MQRGVRLVVRRVDLREVLRRDVDLRLEERLEERLVERRVDLREVLRRLGAARRDVERLVVERRLVLRRLGDARRFTAIFIGLAVSLIASEMRVSMLLRRSLLSSRAAVTVMLSLTYLVFIALLIPDFTARSRPVERISLLVVLRVVLRVERRGAERLTVLRLEERLDVERRLGAERI